MPSLCGCGTDALQLQKDGLEVRSVDGLRCFLYGVPTFSPDAIAVVKSRMMRGSLGIGVLMHVRNVRAGVLEIRQPDPHSASIGSVALVDT